MELANHKNDFIKNLASIKVLVDLCLSSQLIGPIQVVCNVAPDVQGWRNGIVGKVRIWFQVFSLTSAAAQLHVLYTSNIVLLVVAATESK